MAKGQKTGGRTKGVPNKRTTEIVERAAAQGMLPHDFLCAVAQGLVIDGHAPSFLERIDAAKAAAPYFAPKLANIEHTGKDGAPLIPVLNVSIGGNQPRPPSKAG